MSWHRKSLQEVQGLLFDKCGSSIKIVDRTYVSYWKPATFIDHEHGEWITTPRWIIEKGDT